MKSFFSIQCFAALICAAAILSCSSPEKQITNTSWTLQELIVADGATLKPTSDIPSVNFDDSLRVWGNAGCNNFFGRYKIEGKSISLSNLGRTMMFCPNMEIEDAFLKNLANTRHFVLKDKNTLVLSDSLDVVLCTLKKREKTDE